MKGARLMKWMKHTEMHHICRISHHSLLSVHYDLLRQGPYSTWLSSDGQSTSIRASLPGDVLKKLGQWGCLWRLWQRGHLRSERERRPSPSHRNYQQCSSKQEALPDRWTDGESIWKSGLDCQLDMTRTVILG